MGQNRVHLNQMISQLLDLLNHQAGNAEIYALLGQLYYETEKFDDSLQSYEKVLKLEPNHPEAKDKLADLYFKKAVSLHRNNDLNQALSYYLNVTKIKNFIPEVHNNIGLIYKTQNKLHEAESEFKKALSLNPKYIDALTNLGNIYKATGQYELALQCFNEVIELAPNSIGAYNNMGLLFHAQDKFDKALFCFDKALEIDPQNDISHWNKSITLLTVGDLSNGFKEYEWGVLKVQERKGLYYIADKPDWNRPKSFEEAKKQVVAVFHEQGYGDSLQCVRYLAMMKATGITVILIVQQPLINLMRKQNYVDLCITINDLPQICNEITHQVSLLNLPNKFKTTLQNMPNAVPYILVDDDLVLRSAVLMNNIDRPNGLNIGVVWQSSPTDHNRNIPFEFIKHLTDSFPEHTFYSFQKGEAVQELHKHKNLNIVDLDHYLVDFSVTASVVQHCHLIITVDTAKAHLAGALGIQTWTLLYKNCDWRWFRNRQDSPWYPTMRLFRQETLGRWHEPMQEIYNELSKLK